MQLAGIHKERYGVILLINKCAAQSRTSFPSSASPLLENPTPYSYRQLVTLSICPLGARNTCCNYFGIRSTVQVPTYTILRCSILSRLHTVKCRSFQAIAINPSLPSLPDPHIPVPLPRPPWTPILQPTQQPKPRASASKSQNPQLFPNRPRSHRPRAFQTCPARVQIKQREKKSSGGCPTLGTPYFCPLCSGYSTTEYPPEPVLLSLHPVSAKPRCPS
jgi:hypothetical protein